MNSVSWPSKYADDKQMNGLIAEYDVGPEKFTLDVDANEREKVTNKTKYCNININEVNIK